MELIINSKYKLVPLKWIRQDDLSSLFQGVDTVYICDYQEQSWYDYHQFERKTNYAVEKKMRFHNLIGNQLKILSPTQDNKINRPARRFESDRAIHLGTWGLTGRMGQLVQFLQMLGWLIHNRKSYQQILCYNFGPAEFIASIIAQRLLGKKLVIDFEDDYNTRSSRWFYPHYFKWAARFPDSVVCINEHMVGYFPAIPTYVFNGFIDMSYAEAADFSLEEGALFLYSGALDDIRGVDLIPELVMAIRQKLNKFRVIITGSGPLEAVVQHWTIPEVHFAGFLDPVAYDQLIAESTACLVLQKPDHPFSLGSFPSKCEFYAKYQKRIYQLVLRD